MGVSGVLALEAEVPVQGKGIAWVRVARCRSWALFLARLGLVSHTASVALSFAAAAAVGAARAAHIVHGLLQARNNQREV